MPDAVQHFRRLHILVNCAGIRRVDSVQETQHADWDKLIAVIVTGVFHGSRAAVDQTLTQEPGRISQGGVARGK